MALENPTHIHQLVPTNPTPTDPASQGDDHIRAIKRTIKNTFPNITGRIDATQAQLNYTTGLTGNIQTQLDKITGTNLTVGPGLKGGGTLSQNRSISLDFGPLPVMSEDASHPRLIAIEGADSNTLSRASPFTLRRDFDLAKGTSKITTGPGLSGGGDLTGDRQIDLDFGSLPANRDPTLPRLIAMDGVDSGSTYRITPAALRTTFDLAPGSVTINAGSGL
ncbi:hypothetical protein, partial [Paracoccus sp. (in: a-proteobacteria)]|uniref:hypothetical protein n=1 Tax=Paracoccus sp. TaxID=267 RepID=UPI0026DED14C